MLDLVERVRREEGRPAVGGSLAQERSELLLQKRVEPARRLVEDNELGPVHERLDDADLLAVALGELSDGALERDAEPLDKLVAKAPFDPSPEAGQGLELFAGGQAVVETKVAGR